MVRKKSSAKKPASRRPAPTVVKEEFNDTSDWIRSKWRPMMAWQYMATCTCDFIIFPVMYATVQAMLDGHVTEQWHPITLEGAGLYHAAMGAVLGIAAYSRGRERMVAMETYDFEDYDGDGFPDEDDRDVRFVEDDLEEELDIPRPPTRRRTRRRSSRAD